MTARHMPGAWESITQREMAEDYPAAIAQLERLLEAAPSDTEAVVRLGFDYWLAIAEAERLELQVPARQYARRFLELLERYEPSHKEQADFCWGYGLPLTLHYCNFATNGTDRPELDRLRAHGDELLDHAAALEGFYARLRDGKASQDELAARFRGRGSLARYYGVV